MEHFEASSLIDAPPEAIWAVLTDAPAYSEWDSGVLRLDGRVAPGEKLEVTSEVNPKRSYPVKVTAFEPGREMAWSGGVPLKLFTGVRTFSLTPEGGATR
jgi:uncharacterized protein YndB with AHSA1/START domain